ncbi:hypothetical protein [Streptomyces sp. NPDC005573]
MIALALLVPVLLALMMFGLDGFENRLFPPSSQEGVDEEDSAPTEDQSSA